jgi:hypothetical protein
MMDELRQSKNRLARAFYTKQKYGATPAYLQRVYKVHDTEWRWADRAFRTLLLYYDQKSLLEVDEVPDWMAAIDSLRSDITVWVSEVALQDMLFAGIESYCVPQKGKRKFSEVYGLCFGSENRQSVCHRLEGESLQVHMRVERIFSQLRAESGTNYVFPNAATQKVQLDLVHDVFPWLDFLGEFHTHLYSSRQETHQNRGWQASHEDRKGCTEWARELREEGYNPRIALIAAVSAAKRRSDAATRNVGNESVLRTCIAGHHIWIAAYRILSDGTSSSDGIILRCPHFEAG